MAANDVPFTPLDKLSEPKLPAVDTLPVEHLRPITRHPFHRRTDADGRGTVYCGRQCGSTVIEGLTASNGSYALTEGAPPSPSYASIPPKTLQLTVSAALSLDNVPTEITVTK